MVQWFNDSSVSNAKLFIKANEPNLVLGHY